MYVEIDDHCQQVWGIVDGGGVWVGGWVDSPPDCECEVAGEQIGCHGAGRDARIHSITMSSRGMYKLLFRSQILGIVRDHPAL